MKRLPFVLLALLLCVPAHAQEDAAAFFKGKTLRIVVGSGVGSGAAVCTAGAGISAGAGAGCAAFTVARRRCKAARDWRLSMA